MSVLSTCTVAAIALIVLTACLVSARAPPKWHELTPDYTYAQYLADWGKPTPAAAEYGVREANFAMKLREVLVHNNQRRKPLYQKGINHMSDWSAAELKAINGGRSTHPAYQALKKRINSKPTASLHVKSGKQVPPMVDWRMRLPSVLTAVKDQGMCGSCYAFASTATIETHVALATGNLFVLSPEQALQCTPNPDQCGGTGGCGGNVPELVFDYIQQQAGMTQEWNYPYSSYGGVTGTCQSPLPAPVIKQVELTGFRKTAANDQEAVLDALNYEGPLAINVDASQWNTYEGGIYDGCNYANNISIDHVVQLVGYGYDDGLRQQYWLVRNSWSASFGENGYIRLIKHTVPKCGLNVNPDDGVGCALGPNKAGPTQWTCGQCGLLFDVSYPTVQTPKN